MEETGPIFVIFLCCVALRCIPMHAISDARGTTTNTSTPRVCIAFTLMGACIYVYSGTCTLSLVHGGRFAVHLVDWGLL